MNQTILIIASVILLASGGRSVSAASPGGSPTVEISASSARIALGDSVAVRCTVVVPAGVSAGEPVPAEENSYLDFERRAVVEEKTASGVVRKYDFLAYVFSPDSVRVGPFAVQYVAAGDTGRVLSGMLDFRVASFVKSVEDSLKPSRSPLKISGGWLLLWLALLAALLVAALVLYLKRRKRPAPVPVVECPFDEIEAFESIRALHLAETGRVKELYAAVSDAMRGFVHRNMGFEALYSTTDEIRRRLRGWKDRESADAIRDILEESDMVKFARYLPAPERASSLIDRAMIPVRTVLDGIVADRERARLAEEERRRAAAPAVSENAPAGEEGTK